MEIKQQTTVLLTSDVVLSRNFYVDVLGFEEVINIGWFVSLRHPSSGSTLDLWMRTHPSAPKSHRDISGVVLAFVVPEVAEVEQQFLKAGVRIVEPMRDEPWGQRHFIAVSPDGVLLDIVQRIPPQEQWLREHGFV